MIPEVVLIPQLLILFSL